MVRRKIKTVKSLWLGKNPRKDKAPIVAILERDGNVRTFHMERVTGDNIRPAIKDLVEEGSHIMTDSMSKLPMAGTNYKHSVVNHTKKEYVRHEDGLTVTTNTVEGYFSIIKRGINGIYHHVGKQYLDQYLKEFDYRYNVRKMDDTEQLPAGREKN